MAVISQRLRTDGCFLVFHRWITNRYQCFLPRVHEPAFYSKYRLKMNIKLLGTALIAASSTALISGCGILETLEDVEIPQLRFDSNSYIVQPGDTLDSVASRYKIDPDSLININSLELAKLVPGQRLLLLRDDEVGSMATASRTAAASVRVPIASGEATAVGQPIVVPNATQTTVTTLPRAVDDPTIIRTDVLLCKG